ncbi:MAG: polysaccharide biosynthesis protein [Flavobacteriaceae bacterium]|nr:polysaccharide biosynthesis protein [Flavobacteriaceae bacterium]
MNSFYKKSPAWLKNSLITAYNLLAYFKRYGGNYRKYRALFQQRNNWSYNDLKNDQKERYKALINYAIANSPFYASLYSGIDNPDAIENISSLPIVSKEMLRREIEKVYTIPKSKAIISKTGGTTGKSLQVFYTYDNFQERFALLDNFRNVSGYKLGKRTAWFSGKSLLSQSDIEKKCFWRTDSWYHIRYYSTFHLKKEFLSFYIENLKKFRPEFLVGFPSNMYEIAKYGLANNFDFPENTIKAIFPTAETVTDHSREVIEKFFKAKVFDQYASSEGAPFIFECHQGKLHLEMQSGVFEVLDDENNSTNDGRLVVTSFTTYGTPLIRYDIGDNIILSNQTCTCGNNNPLVNKILGRIDDFVYSPENGKINLGNISNTLKDTKGIIKFQVEQNSLQTIVIKMVADREDYTNDVEKIFIKNWRDRIGEDMSLKIKYVEEIPVAKSGKFRLVINNIKHLLE